MIFKFLLGGMLQKQFEDYGYRKNGDVQWKKHGFPSQIYLGSCFGFISWAKLIASSETRFPHYKNGGNNTSSEDW